MRPVARLFNMTIVFIQLVLRLFIYRWISWTRIHRAHPSKIKSAHVSRLHLPLVTCLRLRLPVTSPPPSVLQTQQHPTSKYAQKRGAPKSIEDVRPHEAGTKLDLEHVEERDSYGPGNIQYIRSCQRRPQRISEEGRKTYAMKYLI